MIGEKRFPTPAKPALDGWNPWFAWHPVRAEIGNSGVRAWVWLETIDRKYDSARSYEDVFYLFRRARPATT